MSRLRSVAAAILLALAAVLAPLGVTSVWLADHVADPHQYLATVAPLADDPVVQAGVTDRVTEALVGKLDLPGRIGDKITVSVTNLVHRAVQAAVASSLFPHVWDDANRAAHSAVLDALTGSHGIVTSADGEVAINLAPIEQQVKLKLEADHIPGVSRIPDTDASFVVARTTGLDKARTVFGPLRALGDWGPVAAVALFAAGGLLAVHRRRALANALTAAALATALMLLLLANHRRGYRNRLSAKIDPDAAMAYYDAVADFLRVTLGTVLILTAVLALGTHLGGPSAVATRIRAPFQAAVSGARGLFRGRDRAAGPIGRWFHRNRTALTVVAVAGAAAGFLAWHTVSPAAAAVLVAALLAVVAVLEFLDPGVAATSG